MQANMSKMLTDKEALAIAEDLDEPQVYMHRGSGTLRVAWPSSVEVMTSAGPLRFAYPTVIEKLTYERACELAVYIGWTPTPWANYLAG